VRSKRKDLMAGKRPFPLPARAGCLSDVGSAAQMSPDDDMCGVKFVLAQDLQEVQISGLLVAY
jgi:hypothetical protein